MAPDEFFYREVSVKLPSGFAGGGFFSLPEEGFSPNLFGNGGCTRPTFRAQLTYRIRNDENRFITFTVQRSINTFALPDPAQPDTKKLPLKLGPDCLCLAFSPVASRLCRQWLFSSKTRQIDR